MIVSPFIKKSYASVLSPASVQFGSSAINIFKSITILGVTFTHDFSWNLHASSYTMQDKQYASGYISTKFLIKCGLAFENL